MDQLWFVGLVFFGAMVVFGLPDYLERISYKMAKGRLKAEAEAYNPFTEGEDSENGEQGQA